MKMSNEKLENLLGQYNAEYLQLTNQNLQYILILHSTGIYIFDGCGKKYIQIDDKEKDKFTDKIAFENEESMIKSLTSFISCIDSKVAFNSQTFEAQFGPFSPFYCIAQTMMKEYLEKNMLHMEVVRKEWLRNFGKVYHSGDLDEALYVKHTYLSLLIKVVSIFQISS